MHPVGGRALDMARAADVGDVLEAQGSWSEGATIVLRLSAHVHQPGGGLNTDQDWRATGCYRFAYPPKPRFSDDVSVDTVDCPDSDLLRLPPEPPSYPLPANAQRVLREVLRASGSDRRASEVAADLRQRWADAHLLIEVRESPGWLGVAVEGQAPIATGGYAAEGCLLGRVSTSSERFRVVVWHPPDVLVRPGESTCDARLAAEGGAQQAPH